jgi:exosortase A-associated hydrolase 2
MSGQRDETPFFFPGPHGQLFGVLHRPASGGRLPFVVCHPLAEEKLWAHRALVSIARELCDRGHAVLRFDYLGNGDSDGDFRDSSLSTGDADIDAAIERLRRDTGSQCVGLVGLRLGASLAIRAAQRRPDVDRLVLWAPVVDGSRYLQELLRVNLTTQMAVFKEIREDRPALLERLAAGGVVNIEGYEMSQRMGDELGRLNLLEGPPVAAARSLIAQVERAPSARVQPELEALKTRFPQADLEVVQEEPFWKEIQRFYGSAPRLTELTLSWLERS